MWFQTLKTRHSVRSFSTENSQGLVLGLEYTDRKTEIHALKKETPPLLLEEGVSAIFVTHENGGMSLLGISHSGKGKSCMEIRAWDVMSSLGFTAKEIVVQDFQKNTSNDGKFKAVVNLPESIGTHFSLKMAVLKDFVSVAVSSGLIILWRCRKVENQTISLELVSVMKSATNIHDLALVVNDTSTEKGPPLLVVGESGSIKLYSVTQHTDGHSEDSDKKFSSTHIPFPSSDVGSTVQEIQCVLPYSCVLSDSSGRLWYLHPPNLQEILLPSSQGGHGVFAVQAKEGQEEGWLATVDQGQTINLYKMSDVIKKTDAGVITQPWHVVLSQHSISTISFIEDNVLAGGSNSLKSILLWVGVNHIGSTRLESGSS